MSFQSLSFQKENYILPAKTLGKEHNLLVPRGISLAGMYSYPKSKMGALGELSKRGVGSVEHNGGTTFHLSHLPTIDSAPAVL